jgi:hypothetical protein
MLGGLQMAVEAYFGSWYKVVVAQHHANSAVYRAQRQFQPILHHMFLFDHGAAQNTLGGNRLVNGAQIGSVPILALAAPLHVLQQKAGDFPIIDFPQPGSCQADTAGFDSFANINQTQPRQQARQLSRIDIGPARNEVFTRFFQPIVVKLPLLRHNQLRPERLRSRFVFQCRRPANK